MPRLWKTPVGALSHQTGTPWWSKITANGFGKLHCRAVDGEIYGQILYLPNMDFGARGRHNALLVVTMKNRVYMLDADDPTAAPLWEKNHGAPVPVRDLAPQACVPYNDISRWVGILSTPVIDPKIMMAQNKQNPTVPPVVAARLSGTPIVVHEQNAVLGRANATLAVTEAARAMLLIDGRRRVMSRFLRTEGTLAWFGRIGGDAVPPGLYDVRLRAVDRAGNRSQRTRGVTVRVRYIELSRERYCPIWAMLQPDVWITATSRVVRDDPVLVPAD